LDAARTRAFVARAWEDRILPALTDYIRIPNQSPAFDPEWERHGHMQRAVELVVEWCRAELPPGATAEVVRQPGRTPVILLEIPGDPEHTVLLYGHLDKQPPMSGWAPGLGPWTPVLRDGRLYGRGGADDGYAAFASVTALRALHEQGLAHGRSLVLIEACEESGSYDLPAYIEALSARIGTPELVVCLDSGCADYEQLWCTTSLRGLVAGTLVVEVMSEGVHSGDAGGVVPGAFRVARQLIDRLEDGRTGQIRPAELQVEIPGARRRQAQAAADVLAEGVAGKYPLLKGVSAETDDPVELVLNRTWRPALAVTGQDGLPSIEQAGNVALPRCALQLSLRLAPTCDAEAATRRVCELLTQDPPHGARVSFRAEAACQGWDAPPLADWLARSLQSASRTHFGRPACMMGEGGSIPFMSMLGQRYPRAQFLITGLLGPGSNAHGPNEFLHIETGRRLTCCVAQVLADHIVAARG
jgi:acetylornithine deacetylase/succinyl-diaminopimelate desuccinylase-like protein